MQLSRMLERLSVEERRELCLRRGVSPNLGESRELAFRLALPQSIGGALIDLNAFQHLILRWLFAHFDYAASWKALADEIGDRVSVEYLTEQLRDMRLWGVVDFDSNPAQGFVATYAAVAQAYPKKAVGLRDVFERMTTSEAHETLRDLGVAIRDIPRRKDEREALALTRLREHEFLAVLLQRLSPEARDLLQKARDRGGSVPAKEVHVPVSRDALYYGYAYDRRSFVKMVGAASPIGQLVGACLLVPVARTYSGVAVHWSHREMWMVPAEVMQGLAGAGFFDQGPLRPPKLTAGEGAAGGGRPTVFLLRDTVHLLGYIAAGRCEWRNDGQPYQRSLAAFGKLAGAPDQSYPDLLWELVAGAGLATPQQGGFQVAKLSLRGPADLAERILGGWLSDRVGQGFFRSPIAVAARSRFLVAMRMLPPDTWLRKRSVEDLLAFAWPLLFGPDLGEDIMLARSSLWAFLRALGASEGKMPDGTDVVMVPQAVQRLLAGTKEAREALPPWEDGFTVQADRTIVAPPNAHPAALMDLWRVAEMESNQGAAVFRITRESVAGALNRGLEPKQVLELLQKRSRTPLPPTVVQVIDDQAARYGQIKVGAATAFVTVGDPALLEQLMKDRKLQGIRWQALAPGVAAVRQQDAAALLESLRRAGYLPVLLDSSSKKAAPDGAANGGRARGPKPAPRGRRRAGRAWAAKLDDLVEEAIEREARLTVAFDDEEGHHEVTVEPEDIDGDFLYARESRSGEELNIELDAIHGITMAAPGG